jgi:membrane protein required for colicin V production
MIETHTNVFDIVVLAVMLLSCIFAFFRGFVREMLSLGAWIGAAIITIYYFPDVTQMLKPHFKSSIGAAGVSTLGIYTVALIGFSMINALIMKFIRNGKEVGMLDNLMGLFFGAARGGLILSLGYFMLTIAMPEKEYPEWLKHSITRPYVELGAVKLAKVAPEYLREISTLEKRATAEVDEAKKKPTEDDEPVVHSNSGEDAGYSKTSSRQVDRLIEGSEPSR